MPTTRRSTAVARRPRRKSTGSKKAKSPWIVFCLKLYKTGKFASYTDAMQAASKRWTPAVKRACSSAAPAQKKRCSTVIRTGKLPRLKKPKATTGRKRRAFDEFESDMSSDDDSDFGF
jgi:hypothetical protein